MVVIASLQIGGIDTLRIEVQISRQNFHRNIEILHLVVTQSNVGIDSLVISRLEQDLFVNLSRLFEMSSEVMDGSQTQLIVGCFLKFLMVMHQILLIVLLVGDVEQQPNLEFVFRALEGFTFSVIILAQGVVAAGFIGVVFLIVSFLNEFLVNLYSFPESKVIYLY